MILGGSLEARSCRLGVFRGVDVRSLGLLVSCGRVDRLLGPCRSGDCESSYRVAGTPRFSLWERLSVRGASLAVEPCCDLSGDVWLKVGYAIAFGIWLITNTGRILPSLGLAPLVVSATFLSIISVFQNVCNCLVTSAHVSFSAP